MIIKVSDMKDNEILKDQLHELYRLNHRETPITLEEYFTPDEELTSVEEIKKNFNDSRRNFFSSINFDDEDEFYVVVYRDNILVGSCYFEKNEDFFLVAKLTVAGTYRRHGIASMMIEEGINYIKDVYKEYDIRSWIAEDNKASKMVHQKLGFISDGTTVPLDRIVYEYTLKK